MDPEKRAHRRPLLSDCSRVHRVSQLHHDHRSCWWGVESSDLVRVDSGLGADRGRADLVARDGGGVASGNEAGCSDDEQDEGGEKKIEHCVFLRLFFLTTLVRAEADLDGGLLFVESAGAEADDGGSDKKKGDGGEDHFGLPFFAEGLNAS